MIEETLGIESNNYVLVGNEFDGFRGFEEKSLPLMPFKGDEKDQCLLGLRDYLIKRLLPEFKQKKGTKLLSSDLKLTYE